MLGFPLGILSAAGAGGAVQTFELIQTQIVSGTSTSSITFGSLASFASTYRHLQIRFTARKSNTDVIQILRFNGDTGSNYAYHYMWGNGSTVQSSGLASHSRIVSYPYSGSSYAANSFGVGVIDILDAFSSTKNKTVRQLSGMPAPEIQLASGFWNNTASTTSIELTSDSGTYVAGSRFSLYGIR